MRIFNHLPRKLLEPSWLGGFHVTRLIGADADEVLNGESKCGLNAIHVYRDGTRLRREVSWQ